MESPNNMKTCPDCEGEGGEWADEARVYVKCPICKGEKVVDNTAYEKYYENRVNYYNERNRKRSKNIDIHDNLK